MTDVMNTSAATPEKAAAAKPILQLVGVKKVFADFAAVDGISLDIREGAVSYTHLTLPTTPYV